MTLSEVISIGKDIFLAIAAAITAIVAVMGLRSWSRELKGKAEFEAARNLALATYKLRDALRECRSPFYEISELAGYNPGWGGSADQAEANQFAHIYKIGLLRFWLLFNNLIPMRLKQRLSGDQRLNQKRIRFEHMFNN